MSYKNVDPLGADLSECVVVLHLPDERRSQLADIFDRRLALSVKEAEDKEQIVPGTFTTTSVQGVTGAGNIQITSGNGRVRGITPPSDIRHRIQIITLAFHALHRIKQHRFNLLCQQ